MLNWGFRKKKLPKVIERPIEQHNVLDWSYPEVELEEGTIINLMTNEIAILQDIHNDAICIIDKSGPLTSEQLPSLQHFTTCTNDHKTKSYICRNYFLRTDESQPYKWDIYLRPWFITPGYWFSRDQFRMFKMEISFTYQISNLMKLLQFFRFKNTTLMSRFEIDIAADIIGKEVLEEIKKLIESTPNEYLPRKDAFDNTFAYHWCLFHEEIKEKIQNLVLEQMGLELRKYDVNGYIFLK